MDGTQVFVNAGKITLLSYDGFTTLPNGTENGQTRGRENERIRRVCDNSEVQLTE